MTKTEKLLMKIAYNNDPLILASCKKQLLLLNDKKIVKRKSKRKPWKK